MKADQTILNCTECARLFSEGAAGRVLISPPANLGKLFVAGLVQEFVCGWPDCAAIKLKNATRPQCPRRQQARTAPDGKGARGCGHRPHATAAARNPLPPEDEREFEDQRSETRGQGAVVAPGLSQAGFEASGRADSCNAKLIEFLDHQISSGNLGKFFSRKLLKEICGNDYINNRIDDAREHYEPLGYSIQNAQVSPDGVQPMSSHYRILRKG